MFGLGGSSRKARAKAKVIYDAGVMAQTDVPRPNLDQHISLEGRQIVQAGRMRSRIWLCASLFILVFAGLGARLVDVVLLQEEALAPLLVADNKPLPRPDVTDRRGRHLIMTRPTTGAAIEVRDVWSKEETAAGVSKVLSQHGEESLLRRLNRQKYIVLSEDLSAEEKRDLMKLGLPGVSFFDSEKRVYPQGPSAAHLVGYMEPGRGGRAGLEAHLNQAQYASPLAASVDLTVQQIVEQELAATMQEFSAPAAWAVMMDVSTGEVLALASLPTYNPNDITRSPADHWRNRAMQDLYELGSAFKVLTAAMALEDGVSAPGQKYDVRHPITIADRTIRDYRPKGGFMTLSQVLQYSSNIGMSQVALKLGAKQQKAYLAKLNLLSALESELPEERTPDYPIRWGPVETATISYGHGIAVTPLQLTAAFAATVNGGIFVSPTFLKADVPIERTRVFSPQTSASLRLILRRVVTDGTARASEAKGYYVIGKTATADKPGAGGYAEDKRISSFIGAFPGYAPRYVLLVSFDEPIPTAETHGFATAGIVAAPAFSRIVARAAPALGIAPVNDDVAFAQFMSGLRDNNVQLAMNEADVHELDAEPEDALAKLLSELGP